MEEVEEKLELHEYQKIGALFLSQKRCAILGDRMGIGKTAQAIEAANIIQAKRILIVCPAVARVNWTRELALWDKCHRSYEIIYKQKQAIDPNKSQIVSYDFLAQNKDKKAFSNIDVLIIDEAHFLKNRATKRTKALLGKSGMAHLVKHTWALTGTPATNHIGEMWPILFTFGATKLDYNQFIETFCITSDGEWGGITIHGTNLSKLKEIQAMLDKVMLRRTLEDVKLELPKLSFNKILVEEGEIDWDTSPEFVQYVSPTDTRLEFYKEIAEQEKFLSRALELDHNRERIEDKINLLRGLTGSVAQLRSFNAALKVDAIFNIIKDEVEADHHAKIIIFAVHKAAIEGLRLKLEKEKIRCVTLYGGTPDAKRNKHIDEFQNRPRCNVFIGNIQACGTAINLTASNNIIFLEQSYVPADNFQAVCRAHRNGQKRPVFVRIATLPGSIDERVQAILMRKMKELAQIFDSGRSIEIEFSDLEDDIFS